MVRHRPRVVALPRLRGGLLLLLELRDGVQTSGRGARKTARSRTLRGGSAATFPRFSTDTIPSAFQATELGAGITQAESKRFVSAARVLGTSGVVHRGAHHARVDFHLASANM